jgi:putative DNA primase/helicase
LHGTEGRQGRCVQAQAVGAVDGAELLNDLATAIRRHVVMAECQADTTALWAAHTYLLDCFGISPRLAITSPEKGCGKTTLLDVVSRLVWRPLPTANVTAAAIFRIIEAHRPALLIDEADTFLPDNEELRGVLNSSHRLGGAVIRTVGDDHEPRQFSTYSACAIALIGKLPGTLGRSPGAYRIAAPAKRRTNRAVPPRSHQTFGQSRPQAGAMDAR